MECRVRTGDGAVSRYNPARIRPSTQPHLDVVELHHQLRVVLLRDGPRLCQSAEQGPWLILWPVTPSSRASTRAVQARIAPRPVPRAGSRHPVQHGALGQAQLPSARTLAGMTPAMLEGLCRFGRRHLCCKLEGVVAGRALAGAPAGRQHTRTQEWTNAGALHRDCRILMQRACSAHVGWACPLVGCMQWGRDGGMHRGCARHQRDRARCGRGPCSFRGRAQLRPRHSPAVLSMSWQREPRREFPQNHCSLA